jgi:hypothetical protein
MWGVLGTPQNNFTVSWDGMNSCDANSAYVKQSVCWAHYLADGTVEFSNKYYAETQFFAAASVAAAEVFPATNGLLIWGAAMGNLYVPTVGFQHPPSTQWGSYLLMADLNGGGWIAYSGGSGADVAMGLAVDRVTRGIYVTGTTQSNHFGSSTQNSAVGGVNLGTAGADVRYVARYTQDGGVSWVFGLDSWSVTGTAQVAAENDSVWVAAPFSGALSALTSGVTGGLTASGLVGSVDLALVRLDPSNGIPTAGYVLGGARSTETVTALRFDGDAGLTLVGTTSRGDWDAGLGWPASPGTFFLTYDTTGGALALRSHRFIPDAGAQVMRYGTDSLNQPVIGGQVLPGGSINFGSGPVTQPGTFIGRLR